jgi:RNA polymerase primary sigma factor
MYLREMGTVPLLTREGEVEIAKRIERGQMRVLKAISRSPIVIREIVALGEDLKRGVRNVKEVVIFDEEELTEEVVQRASRPPWPASTRWSSTRRRLRSSKRSRPPSPPTKAKISRRAPHPLADRPRKGLVSRIVRELKYTAMERKRLLDKVNKTVDTMRTLERQIRSLEQKHEPARARS